VTSAPGDHPEARAEYLEAVAYYDDLRSGLGEELIDRFENAIQEILGDPNSWPLVPEWDEEPVLRSRRIETFRYRIVYYVRDEQVRIIAYAHMSREPGYWTHRVER
jgi:Txe/YoeB family toxin of Txe-Axe toxin-antitoxin module